MMAAPLLTALFAGTLAAGALTQELDNPPEDPPPRPPPDLPLAPSQPVVRAPDARDLLTGCDQPLFTDCFRMWQPPSPPPPAPPPPRRADTAPSAGAPPPADPKSPIRPAQAGGASPSPPPAPDPAAAAADRATYDALVRAVRDAGLEGRILMPDAPTDGSATLRLEEKPASPAKGP